MTWIKINDDDNGTYAEINDNSYNSIITLDELNSKLNLAQTELEKLNLEPDSILMSNDMKFMEIEEKTMEKNKIEAIIEEWQ